jgi:hypothetical protein
MLFLTRITSITLRPKCDVVNYLGRNLMRQVPRPELPSRGLTTTDSSFHFVFLAAPRKTPTNPMLGPRWLANKDITMTWGPRSVHA